MKRSSPSPQHGINNAEEKQVYQTARPASDLGNDGSERKSNLNALQGPFRRSDQVGFATQIGSAFYNKVRPIGGNLANYFKKGLRHHTGAGIDGNGEQVSEHTKQCYSHFQQIFDDRLPRTVQELLEKDVEMKWAVTLFKVFEANDLDGELDQDEYLTLLQWVAELNAPDDVQNHIIGKYMDFIKSLTWRPDANVCEIVGYQLRALIIFNRWAELQNRLDTLHPKEWSGTHNGLSFLHWVILENPLMERRPSEQLAALDLTTQPVKVAHRGNTQKAWKIVFQKVLNRTSADVLTSLWTSDDWMILRFARENLLEEALVKQIWQALDASHKNLQSAARGGLWQEAEGFFRQDPSQACKPCMSGRYPFSYAIREPKGFVNSRFTTELISSLTDQDIEEILRTKKMQRHHDFAAWFVRCDELFLEMRDRLIRLIEHACMERGASLAGTQLGRHKSIPGKQRSIVQGLRESRIQARQSVRPSERKSVVSNSKVTPASSAPTKRRRTARHPSIRVLDIPAGAHDWPLGETLPGRFPRLFAGASLETAVDNESAVESNALETRDRVAFVLFAAVFEEIYRTSEFGKPKPDVLQKLACSAKELPLEILGQTPLFDLPLLKVGLRIFGKYEWWDPVIGADRVYREKLERTSDAGSAYIDSGNSILSHTFLLSPLGYAIARGSYHCMEALITKGSCDPTRSCTVRSTLISRIHNGEDPTELTKQEIETLKKRNWSCRSLLPNCSETSLMGATAYEVAIVNHERSENAEDEERWVKVLRIMRGHTGVADLHTSISISKLMEIGNLPMKVLVLCLFSYLMFALYQHGDSGAAVLRFSSHYLDKFIDEEFESHHSHIRKTFLDISVEEELWQWMDGPLLNGLFDLREPGVLDGNTILVGPVRLRQLRLRGIECTSPLMKVASKGRPDTASRLCFKEGVYENRPLGSLHMPGAHYVPERNIDLSYHLANFATDTMLGDWYSLTGGYVVDLPIQNRSSAERLVHALRRNEWLQPWNGTRALFVHLAVYDPNTDRILTIRLGIEFWRSGGCYPTASSSVFRVGSEEQSAMKAFCLSLLVICFIYRTATELDDIAWGHAYGIARVVEETAWGRHYASQHSGRILDHIRRHAVAEDIYRWFFPDRSLEDEELACTRRCRGVRCSKHAGARCTSKLLASSSAWIGCYCCCGYTGCWAAMSVKRGVDAIAKAEMNPLPRLTCSRCWSATLSSSYLYEAWNLFEFLIVLFFWVWFSVDNIADGEIEQVKQSLVVTLSNVSTSSDYVPLDHAAAAYTASHDLLAMTLVMTMLHALRLMSHLPAPFGPRIMAITRTICHSKIIDFYFVLVIMIIATAIGYNAAFGSDLVQYSRMRTSFRNAFTDVLAGDQGDFNELAEVNILSTYFIRVLTLFVVGLYMLNIFIAVVSNAYEDVQRESVKLFAELVERHYLQSTMPFHAKEQALQLVYPSAMHTLCRELDMTEENAEMSRRADVTLLRTEVRQLGSLITRHIKHMDGE